MSVVALLALRMALHAISTARFVAVGALAVVWAVAVVIAWRRMGALRPVRPAAPGATVAVVGFCAVGVALVGVALAIADLL